MCGKGGEVEAVGHLRRTGTTSLRQWGPSMFLHVQRLINEIVPDEPDPAAANALQEGLGGQFGEMRTMMQYLFQAFNSAGRQRSRTGICFMASVPRRSLTSS